MEALMNNENLWHIQEQIFGYLDDETVEICQKVCQSWNATFKKFSYNKFCEEFGEKEIGYSGKTVSTFIPGWRKAFKKYGAQASIDDLQEVKDSLGELVKYDGRCCYYPVHKSAEIGAVKLMKLILNTSYDLNAKTEAGKTPLHWACEYGRTETVELLIKSSSIDLNATNIMGRTSLHLACINGRTKVVELLIKSSKDFGIDLSARVARVDCSADTPRILENDGYTAFQLACKHGPLEIVELMIKSSKDFSIDLNARDNTYLGSTALHQLFGFDNRRQNNKIRIIELMMKNWKEFGIDIKAQDNRGKTPLAQAKQCSGWGWGFEPGFHAGELKEIVEMLENEYSKMDDKP